MIRFNEDWLRSPEMSEWLVKVSNDSTKAYCRWCAILLRAHKSDLMTHSTTAKHAKNSSSSGFPTGPLNVQVITADDVNQITKEAEDTKPDPGALGTMTGHNMTTPTTPRTQYAKKYRLEWEDMDELKDWLQPLPDDSSKAYCKVCHVQLRAHKHDLVLHGKSTKHKRSAESMGESNYLTVTLGVDGLNETTGSILEFSSTPVAKKRRLEINEEGEEITDADNSNGTVGEIICEDSEILPGDIKELKEELEEVQDKKTGEISIIRVPAGINRGIARGSMRKRRMVASEVISAIAMNEFTGYELLQIVKAAVPKL